MRRSEGRRRLILEAAQEVMLRHGLRGASMEAIARAAGIAKPTLYAYFPHKSAVYAALLEQLAASWREDFMRALEGEGDVIRRVGSALTAKHKAAMRLLAGSPHAAELYGAHERIAAAQMSALEADLVAALERALLSAGVARARLIAQMLLAASAGIGQKAQSPAELGPALRLLSERLIRPELPDDG
ncbi:MAG TPA: helix-turn-helix domain-containing protein [Devosia sp.]|nr:helix-turn-helix domain-containing protein [Devosia sp.]